MFRKLSTKISLALIAIMSLLMALFTVGLIRNRTKEMDRLILEKGITAATVGARFTGNTLDNMIDNGIFSINEVFDRELVPIKLPSAITRKYLAAGIEPKSLSSVQKYHYATGMDSYLDNLVLPVEDEFLRDPQFTYAVMVDINGYVPAHNSIYNRPLTGDFAFDLLHNRTKRIFNDEVGIKSASHAENNYFLQIYKRDTGELMWDVTFPVLVKGRHWGAFRVGFSMEKAEKATASLRNKLILIMGFLLLIMVIVIDRVTAAMMKPLLALHDGVEKVAKGDLSFHQAEASGDEVGDLARAFNKMTDDLKVYIKNLQETTAAKERIESELSIAKGIQAGMLPRLFPPFPERKEFDLHASMEPAKEVGGDFFDFFFVTENKLCIIIADVSGKGVPAALYMVITKTLLKTEGLRGLPPCKILAAVNAILFPDNDACMFATVFCAVLDTETGEMEFANAGHNPPLLCAGPGRFEFLTMESGMVLGVAESFPYNSGKIRLSEGDTMFLYTDGVTEAMNPENALFSEKKLQAVLNTLKNESAENILRRIRVEIAAFAAGTPQSDDITMIVLKYRGPKKS
ncbi:MAG: SpoIIE family protein phosphatase [Elusimicrobia bacterium]|nr:SpoIIE family protein phosphatase [Elusimicrobiota bacterium]